MTVGPSRAYRLGSCLLLSSLLASCGGDGGTGIVVAASLVVAGGDGQRAPLGDTLPQSLAVTVNGSNGQPFAGATVTWSVAPAAAATFLTPTSVSGADGRASTVVVLGFTAGTVSITATVANVPPANFSFQAVEPCSFHRPYTIGQTVNGVLATRDCLLNGFYYDYHCTTNSSAQWLRFSETSTAFDAFLELRDSTNFLFAVDDDEDATTTNSAIRILAGPGPVVIGATTFLTGRTGQYTISSGATSTDVTNCDAVWLTRNVQTNQQIQVTDCTVGDTSWFDGFSLALRAGQQVTITQSSAAVTEFLFAVYVNASGSFVIVGADVGGTTTDAQFTFTAPVTSFTASSSGLPYFVLASTDSAFETGAYSLTVFTTGLAMGPAPGLPPKMLRDLPTTTRARIEQLLQRSGAISASRKSTPARLHRQDSIR